MCIGGKIGAKIKIPKNSLNLHEYLFGEDQSRYIVEVNEKNKDKVIKNLEKSNTYFEIIGKTQKESLSLDKEFNVKIDDLSKFSAFWYKDYFKEQ